MNNKKNNFWKQFKRNNKNIQINIIVILFIIINLINQIFSIENKINNKKRSLDSDNYVIIKVNKTGKIKILGNSVFDSSEIYLNEEKVNSEKNNGIYININSSIKENIIKIKFNRQLDSTFKMFYGCSSLISIDLSNFDT